MNKTCFLCFNEEVVEEVENKFHTRNLLNSFLLDQILEMPHLSKSNSNTMQPIEEIPLCSLCLTRVLNIQNLLEQLEKLEKRVIYEKQLIEVQLKDSYARNSHFRQQNPMENSLQELRTEIVTELKSETIEVMLTKIRKKQVGRASTKRIRIMKDVRIEKLRTPMVQENLEHNQGHNSLSVEVPMDNSINLDSLIQTSFQTNQTFIHEIVNNSDVGRTTIEYDIEHSEIKEEAVDYSVMELLDPLNAPTDTNSINDILAPMEGSGIDSANFICGVCGVQFNNYTELANHDQIHLNAPSDSKFMIEVEEPRILETSVSENPVSASSGHSGATKAKCHICSKWFKSPRILRQHVKRMHVGAPKPRPKIIYPRICSKCDDGVSYPSVSTWSDHLREVHPGKFRCSFCQKPFQIAAQLKKHVVVHLEPKFQCNLCPSLFKRSYDYRIHLKHMHKVEIVRH